MKLSHESRLLLYCAQTRISKDTLNKVKDIISHPLNWEEVLKSAIWHRIEPLLYYNLKDIKESHFIPQEVMYQLRKAYYGNLVRNMYIYAELKRIVDAFREEDVEVIVLKGAALAETVYGNIGLRCMNDIDLLVKKEDILCAERIISGLGYLFKGAKPPEWYRINHQHISYIHINLKICVEIHWHISNKSHPFRIRCIGTDIIEKWWEEAKTMELSGSKALTLCPEDLILCLCIHFFKHRFYFFGSFKARFNSKRVLIQLCDIFLTIKHFRDEINWVRFRYKTEKYGLESLIYTTFLVVRESIGEHDDIFNNTISGFLPESLDKKLVRIINKRIFIREEDPTIVPGSLIQSQVACSFHEKVKILLRYIFPNPEVISKRYNVPLSSKRLYFYYLIRPLSLLLKYRKTIWEIPRIKEEVILNKWISGKD